MANIYLKSEDQVSTYLTFTMVEDLDVVPKPRWNEHEIGGRSGGIAHFTGYSDQQFTLNGIITSHANLNTLMTKILAGTVCYLDASELDSNKSGKIYIVGCKSRQRRGTLVRYEFSMECKRYNN